MAFDLTLKKEVHVVRVGVGRHQEVGKNLVVVLTKGKESS